MSYKDTPPLSDALVNIFGGNTLHSAKVVRICDGDTFWVACDISQFNNEPYRFKLRLAEYDTPELRPKKGTPEEKTEEKRRAKLYKEHISEIILGETIDFHVKCVGKYGRFISKVYPRPETWEKKYKNHEELFKSLIEKDPYSRLDIDSYWTKIYLA